MPDYQVGQRVQVVRDMVWPFSQEFVGRRGTVFFVSDGADLLYVEFEDGLRVGFRAQELVSVEAAHA